MQLKRDEQALRYAKTMQAACLAADPIQLRAVQSALVGAMLIADGGARCAYLRFPDRFISACEFVRKNKRFWMISARSSCGGKA